MDKYNELTALRDALQTVASTGPKYVRPTYLNGIFNALANVEKQIAEMEADGFSGEPMPIVL